MNGTGVTEFYLEAHTAWCDDSHQPRDPAAEHKDDADSTVHEGVYRLPHSGHRTLLPEEKCCDSKESNKKYLTSTGIKPMMAQMIKHLPAMRETQVRSLGWEDPLERGMATIPVLLPGESHGWRNLVGYSPRGCREWTQLSNFTSFSFF